MNIQTPYAVTHTITQACLPPIPKSYSLIYLPPASPLPPIPPDSTLPALTRSSIAPWCTLPQPRRH
ncbi:hypothetical protein M427DRAFT_56476 [Gonapodya prolifera JEL478]|uniref:Uncharacterized protein n=1 Tax=Gonapodya prolifera (strain JEL478) TaxID=1344416 RepID=A0A139AHM6_GONPJ|nr:hypothetical protein M427DRAFT_56476 [Gonapodya prolifera JEL478]|eukprot:KXS15913.1 hypothetical protein M427DRAFT_56476 [Gonapodya prolifera JEL478]